MTWTMSSRTPIRLVLAVAAVLALVFAGLVAAPVADAAPKKPKVSWSFSPSIVRPGATVTVRYKVSKVPKKAKVRLERKKGKKWVRVKTLKRGSGSTTFKAAKKGTRTYRVVVKSRKGKVLRAAKKKIKVTPAQPKVIAMNLSATRVSEGEQITLRYGVASVPKGAKVRLQRAVGTAKKWTDVMSLTSTSTGELKIAAPTIGEHPYRVVVKSTKGKVLAKSRAKRIYSYREIPLGELMGWGSGTADVGGTLFRYVWSNRWLVPWGDRSRQIMSFDRMSCRTATLQSAFSSAYTEGAKGVIALTQETADMQSMTMEAGRVNEGSFILSGDAAEFVFHPSVASGVNYSVYINGSLSCYTLDGTR